MRIAGGDFRSLRTLLQYLFAPNKFMRDANTFLHSYVRVYNEMLIYH